MKEIIERIKRKLALFYIPSLAINDKDEIYLAFYKYLQDKQLLDDFFGEVEFDKEGSLGSGLLRCNYIVVEAVLGVVESSVFFVDKDCFENLNAVSGKEYCAIFIYEKNIVESIEVALMKINSSSSFYGRQLKVIQAKDISGRGIVFFVK